MKKYAIVNIKWLSASKLAWAGLIVLAYLFLLAPLLVVCVTSFDSRPYLAFPPQSYSFDSYRHLLDNQAFLHAFLNSAAVGLVTAVLAVGFGTLGAWVTARHSFRGRTLVQTLFLSPLLVPHIVLGLALLLVLSHFRLLDSYTGLVLAHLGITLPYVVRTVGISIRGMDPRLLEAARVHGASARQAFIHVTLPSIRSGLLAGAVIAFLVSFDEAVISLFIVGTRVSTLPVEIYHYVEYRTDPQIAALSVVLILISLVLVAVVERLFGLRRALQGSSVRE